MSTSNPNLKERLTPSNQDPSATAATAHPEHGTNPQPGAKYQACVARSARESMVLEAVDLGPLGVEDVEVAVEHCGLCHSDLSILNNDWGISQYPAILGHEVVGRISALGPNARGLQLG